MHGSAAEKDAIYTAWRVCVRACEAPMKSDREICSKMATLIQHEKEEGVVGGFDLAVQNRPGLDNDCCSSNGARVLLETEAESVR